MKKKKKQRTEQREWLISAKFLLQFFTLSKQRGSVCVEEWRPLQCHRMQMKDKQTGSKKTLPRDSCFHAYSDCIKMAQARSPVGDKVFFCLVGFFVLKVWIKRAFVCLRTRLNYVCLFFFAIDQHTLSSPLYWDWDWGDGKKSLCGMRDTITLCQHSAGQNKLKSNQILRHLFSFGLKTTFDGQKKVRIGEKLKSNRMVFFSKFDCHVAGSKELIFLTLDYPE